MFSDNIVNIFASFFMWQTEASVLFEQCAVDCYYCGLLFGSFFGKMRSSAASLSLSTVYQIWLLGAIKLCQNQSHYRKVTLWDIFMEQELRFGLDLGWIWAGLANFEPGFFMLSNIFGIERN